VAGNIFLRRIVEILPTFSNKRQAVDISQQIQEDISAYLVTITVMNGAVGVTTAAAMYFCGLGDPLLWGVTAFLLNYIPIIGPLFGVCIFVLVGLLSFESLWWALLPPAIYLGIHLVEGETLTPMLLARRFTLNPVLIILSLVFWFWMWGVLGEREQRPIIVQRKPDHVLLFGHRVRLRRIFREAVCRDKATALRLQPAAPVRRGGVTDIRDRRAAGARRRRHSPTHHGELTFGTRVTHHGRRVVGKDPGHRWQVADVPIYHPEECDDGGLVRGNRIEVAPPVHMIKLTQEREVRPYVWVHPDDER